jgi:hypothetical protein
MQRGGPRSTIPPPSERRPAGPRWPLQVLLGIGVVGAVFLGLRLLGNESTVAQDPADRATRSRGDIAQARDQRASSAAPSASRVPAAPLGLDAFVGQLRRAESYVIFGDIAVPGGIRASVAELRIAEAAAGLEALARANDRDANVALARLELTCKGEEPDTQRSTDAAHAEVAARTTKVPAQMRERIEASMAVRQERIAGMSTACAQARFDSRAISQRLQDAAAAGHEVSLWQLGNLADSEAARKYWLSAAMLGFVPAQVDLAQSLMLENSSGDRRERGAMNFWLQSAARNSPQGKLLLGECLVTSCNAQPPDMATAGQVLREAVFLGVASAPTTLASIPADDAAAPTDAEMYSFNSFLQRLNDLGCYGADLYPTNALHVSDQLQQLGLRLSPAALEEARRLSDQAWREHGAQARAAWHCE